MKFIFPRNEAEVDGKETSVTCDVVDTKTDCKRTNKRKLREYLTAYGILPAEHKKVLKAMGFWGEGLGK